MDWDASILKDFRVIHNDYLQIRLESFNVNNHPVFGAPQLSPTASNFGQINGTANSPRIIQLGAIYRF